MELTHLLMLVLLLMHAVVAHLIHGPHLVHRVHGGVHWMHGIHLIHLTHVVHLMHGIYLIHLMHGIHLIHLIHGIHAVAPSVRRHPSLWHVALFSHAVAPVHTHTPSWAHAHLLVGIVHTHVLRPHASTLVSTITILLPTKIENRTKFKQIQHSETIVQFRRHQSCQLCLIEHLHLCSKCVERKECGSLVLGFLQRSLLVWAVTGVPSESEKR